MQQITTPEGRTALLALDGDLTPTQGLALAEAAAMLLARSGMLADGALLTGPHLLQFLDELGEQTAQQNGLYDKAIGQLARASVQRYRCEGDRDCPPENAGVIANLFEIDLDTVLADVNKAKDAILSTDQQ